MGSFTKKEQIVILFIVFIIILSLSYKFLIKDLITHEEPLGLISQVNIDTKLDISEEGLQEEDNEDPLIFVHISGQVYNSGIVELVRGDRVIDAVKLAGGLTKEADLDRINLAKKVLDEEKIYIPKVNEIMIGEEAIFPTTVIVSEDNTGKVNINLCSNEDLESLPGIGEVIASRITEYRSSNPFKTIDELKNVSGIGDKKFEGIKELVTVK